MEKLTIARTEASGSISYAHGVTGAAIRDDCMFVCVFLTSWR